MFITYDYFSELYPRFWDQLCVLITWRSLVSSRFWKFEQLLRCIQESIWKRGDSGTLIHRMEVFQAGQWCWEMRIWNQTEINVIEFQKFWKKKRTYLYWRNKKPNGIFKSKPANKYSLRHSEEIYFLFNSIDSLTLKIGEVQHKWSNENYCFWFSIHETKRKDFLRFKLKI